MGRYRAINDEKFWRSPTTAYLSQEDKSTLGYLLTSPFSNIIGIYQMVMRISASEMGWTEAQMIVVLKRLDQLNLIRFNEATGAVWVLIWWEHNKVRAAFVGNVARQAQAQLLQVPDEWRSAAIDWIIQYDATGDLNYLKRISDNDGASSLLAPPKGLGSPLGGADPTPTPHILTPNSTPTGLLGNGGGELNYELDEIIDAAIWAATRRGDIKNKVGYRLAVKTRIQQKGASAEDVQTLAAWRAEKVKANEQAQTHQRLTQKAEDERLAVARDNERIHAAFSALSSESQTSVLQQFQEHVAAYNPMVHASFKKQGLKSPLVQAALNEYLRTLPNLISEIRAA